MHAMPSSQKDGWGPSITGTHVQAPDWHCATWHSGQLPIHPCPSVSLSHISISCSSSMRAGVQRPAEHSK